ncbi:uncharacterized protein LOC110246004 [Exaiptasia diaphana]|uniref:F-box domain-containing protein n=1 Tax=Exaiptasia diaphana TaxID=2652724 RepID=A0A913XR57_EXADI|nr:uncharacterized protein LOC110246004 [Exaiptasia diaphana]
MDEPTELLERDEVEAKTNSNVCQDVKKPDFTTSSWLENLPTEILIKIFKYQRIQENILGIGLVCRRFHLITATYPELWSTLESSAEFSVESFKHIMTHARDFKVLALKFSQKPVRYNSPEGFIEGYLSLCINIEELDLCYNTSIVDLTFLQSLPNLKKLTLEGCTSIDPQNMLNNLKESKTLRVLDVSSCLQLDGEQHKQALLKYVGCCHVFRYLKLNGAAEFLQN